MASIQTILLNLTKRLYPTGRAFRMKMSSDVEKLNKGLIESESEMVTAAEGILDQILADNDNFTEENASDWERRLAIRSSNLTSLDDRKAAILRKYAAPGDIPARSHYLYLQAQIQAAGFTDVYVYENRFSTGIVGGWNQVGNTFDIPEVAAGTRSMVWMSSTRIAYFDEFIDVLRTYEFDGSGWAQVGNDFAYDSEQQVTMARLSDNSIAIFGNNTDDLRTYQFDGNNWTQVGNDLNLPGLLNVSITGLTANRIALCENGGDTLRTYQFDGSDWAQVGNSLIIAGGVLVPTITTLDSSCIAFLDSSSSELRKYYFDGSDWAQVGSGLVIAGFINFEDISAVTPNRVVYYNSTAQELRTYDWDGSNWSNVDAFAHAGSLQTTFTVFNQNRIAIYEPAGIELKTLDLNSSSLGYVTRPPEDFTFELGNVLVHGAAEAVHGASSVSGGTVVDKVANFIDVERDNLFVVPSDLRATFYISGIDIELGVDVPIERRDELRQIILQVKPLQTVGFMLVNYV